MCLVECLNLKCKTIVEEQKKHSCCSTCVDGLHYGLCTQCEREMIESFESQFFDTRLHELVKEKGIVKRTYWEGDIRHFVLM